ncbi:MAG: nucleoside recognition domain-containing protein [Bacillota bacterium]
MASSEACFNKMLQVKEQRKRKVMPDVNVTNVLGKFGYLLIIFAMYGLPVYAAYLIATFVEPIVEMLFIIPIEARFISAPTLINQIFVGPFGLLTLGIYSFIWAFPVVVLVGISIAITNDIGLKDKVTVAIDPWLRKIGLTGRDIIPIISGYGCNVVAVYQSRGCSACTRKQCLSMISFGSACSYQVGATLSLFSVAGKPWMFFPYIVILAIIGSIHTKIWYPQQHHLQHAVPRNRQSLRKLSSVAVIRNVKETVQQFFFQAMPIFLVICVIASILDTYKILEMISKVIGPILAFLSLPADASLGILFSILRKDGMLLFNEGNGQLLAGLTAMELFILVYIASTLSACLVTLFAIGKDVSKSVALQIASKQAITSVVTTLFIVMIWKVFC